MVAISDMLIYAYNSVPFHARVFGSSLHVRILQLAV
jgi:hypothetical protein